MTKEFLTIAQQYGIPFALVIFFIWRDWSREQKLTARIEVLESTIRNVLIDLVSKTSGIIVANAESMKAWIVLLKERPCIADELAKQILEKTLKIQENEESKKG